MFSQYTINDNNIKQNNIISPKVLEREIIAGAALCYASLIHEARLKLTRLKVKELLEHVLLCEPLSNEDNTKHQERMQTLVNESSYNKILLERKFVNGIENIADLSDALYGYVNKNYEISKLFTLSKLDFSRTLCPNPLESYMRIPPHERAILDKEIRGKFKTALMCNLKGLDIVINAEQKERARP